MAGLLDSDSPLTEDKAASKIMQELGFEQQEPEPVQEEGVPENFLQLDENGEDPRHHPEEVEEDPELDDGFREAEKRLEKALLYRQLIKGRFFDGDNDLVLEVENELKEFVKKQYLVLSGAIVVAAPVQVEKDFSAEEIVAIKTLAGRILKSPKIMEPVKPTRTPPKPVSAPVAVKPPAPAQKATVTQTRRPQLQTRKVPEEITQSKPTSKPVTNPAAQKPRAVPTPTKVMIPADGSVLEENGQKFNIRYVDMINIDEFGIMDGGKIRKLSSGSACFLSNGIQVIKDGADVKKILRTAVTDNTNIPGRIPFPTNSQMSVITQNNALAAAARLPPTLGSILGR